MDAVTAGLWLALLSNRGRAERPASGSAPRLGGLRATFTASVA